MSDGRAGRAHGVELVPREGWKPYVRAAIQTARLLPARGPQERKTGLGTPVAHRSIVFRQGWLRLEAA